MDKTKSKLQIAKEEVDALVKLTNSKIMELGIYTRSLHNALTMIQVQFDKIRNVPSEKQLEYQKIKEVCLTWKQQVEKIESDYEAAAKANVGRGVAGGALGAGVAALGPTAAMGIATTFGVASTGTAISALSGAAATNAALAWLGGGALAAGGGGMAAGNALLALAGPVGWVIAGVALVGSGLLFLKAKSDKEKLENIFLLISKRDQTSYKQAIVELDERIKRIIDETMKLTDAIQRIVTFGTDYNAMTEEQQYTLGSYVNLMNASVQLLVNPILGLQPKFTEGDLDKFITRFYSLFTIREYCNEQKKLIVYMANLLYKIDTDESERKLLSKSFRDNKEFIEKMGIKKKDITSELFEIVNRVLDFTYANRKRTN
ncbi:hypothetical protein QUW14_15995 [Bacteroides gallinaceum]|uniref:hypothetical protein n=1 Tax=Bacteroides gallinaceum TaxID=1462571 RepID=UPI0025A43FD4|nr:hypothetical protein [Bacteroides gallinaceum]MDM8155775.1 hypothetical protein [Bacteroides gallinaceum]